MLRPGSLTGREHLVIFMFVPCDIYDFRIRIFFLVADHDCFACDSDGANPVSKKIIGQQMALHFTLSFSTSIILRLSFSKNLQNQWGTNSKNVFGIKQGSILGQLFFCSSSTSTSTLKM